MENIEFNKKYVFWGLGILIFIFLIIFVSVYIYKTRPSYKIKTTLKMEISYLHGKIKNLKASTYDYLMQSQQLAKNKKSTYTPKPLTVTTDLNFDLSLSKALDKTKNSKLSIVENLLNNSDIEFKTNLDLDKNYVDGKFNYKNDNEKMNLSYYVKDDEMYVYSKDFLDKYLVLVGEDNEDECYKNIVHLLSCGLTYSDINTLLTILSNTVDEVKINDKIISSKTNIKIGAVSKETKKYTLNIDNELASRFLTKLISNILNSQSALKVINKFEGSEDVSTTREKLSALYVGIKTGKITLLTQEQNIKMNICMQGFFSEFLMQEIEYDFNDNYNGKFSFLKHNVDNYSKHFTLEQGKYNITLNTLEQSNNKNNLQVVIKKDNITKYIFELSGVLSAQKVNVTYNLKSETLNMCTGSFEYAQTFENKEKKSKLKFKFDAQNIDYGKGTVEAAFKIKNVNSVRQQEINNKIAYSELSENDIGVIKVKILNKMPTLYKLIK